MGQTVNMRRQMGVSKDNYIQDGLTGMWDAEWNVGNGEHSSTTTVWKDLSPAGRDLTMRSGEDYYSWEDNRLRCEGKGYVASLTVNFSNFQTIECVFSIDDIEKDGTLRMQQLIRAGDDQKGEMANAWKSPPNVGVQFGESGSNSAIHISDSYSEFNGKVFNVSGIFTTPQSSRIDKAYCNGVQGSVYAPGNTASGNFFTIGGQSGDGRPVKGYIYSIRLYNRALSFDEVNHNYQIDKQRFNI